MSDRMSQSAPPGLGGPSLDVGGSPQTRDLWQLVRRSDDVVETGRSVAARKLASGFEFEHRRPRALIERENEADRVREPRRSRQLVGSLAADTEEIGDLLASDEVAIW